MSARWYATVTMHGQRQTPTVQFGVVQSRHGRPTGYFQVRGPYHSYDEAKQAALHFERLVKRGLGRYADNSQWHDQLRGGKADRLTPTMFPTAALRIGIQHEREHTKDRHVAMEIAMDHLAEDPAYYKKLERIEKNPSVSHRQQRFMCAEYGRIQQGQRTRTDMTKRQLREFCMRRKKRQTRAVNPHLRSGKWHFLGIFEKGDIGSVKRVLKIHGIKQKVTKDHLKGEPGKRELYVEKGAFDTAYRAITRLYEGSRG